MPEMPEVQDELEVSVAPPPDVPLRQGEDRFASLLNMEDGRRKESIIAELTALFKQMTGTSIGELRRRAEGSNEKRRRLDALRKVEELRKLTYKRDGRWYGPCAPATVINLNPVPHSLQGELQRWTIPAAGKGNVVNLNYKGRTFHGSYMTIASAHVYGAHKGTTNDKQSGSDMPAVEFQYIPPLGLVHQFYEHFVEGANDAQYIGGILMFEGDIHTIDKKQIDASDGKVWVPKKEITLEGSGDVLYIAEPRSLMDCVEKAVMMQRRYADAQIAEGHSYSVSQSEIIRNQLSNYHRIWHNYALEKGYIEKALPWAVERLSDSPNKTAVYCPDCRTRQGDPDQFFCTNCNAPFDALKAFLAGKAVSPDRLSVYEGEEWDAIVTETKRRKAKIALLDEEQPKKKKTKAELKAEAEAAAKALEEAKD